MISKSEVYDCAFIKLVATLFLIAGVHFSSATNVFATQIDIQNPGPGSSFGGLVHALPNGNFVATGSDGAASSTVFLFNPEGQVLSALEGVRLYTGGITVLDDGNFVVCSPEWSGESASGNFLYRAGAVTWVDGSVGLTGEVSAENSLIGSQANDRVCAGGIVPLPGGRYVVSSWLWTLGALHDVGAVTLCEGLGACSGVVTAENSLTGSSWGDAIGRAVIPLANGNYVVASPQWNRDGVVSAGAVTLCTTSNSCGGQLVSEQNSLVGTAAGERVGFAYSTYIDGRYPGVIPLSNGNFVVITVHWNNGNIVSAGAVTWVNGWTGVAGTVSADNSLVGSSESDILNPSISVLVDGDYVVNSSRWNRGAIEDAGASTLCSGSGGCVGPISVSNSLVGASAHDKVGFSATALTNGNYVIHSPLASIGGRDRNGAITWCDGKLGCIGVVAEANSLIGGSDLDQTGVINGIALEAGAYVVNASAWDRGDIVDAGISFRCGDPAGCVGVLSASTALVGTNPYDQVGGGFPPIVLANGNYVVQSNDWQGNAAIGALTWIDGRKGLVGEVSESNSFVGTFTDPGIGDQRIFALPNGDYISTSPSWDNGRKTNAGAISLLRGYGPQVGTINPNNSVIGNVAFAGRSLSYSYSEATDTLIVGKYHENIVTLLRVDQLFFNGVD